MMNDSVSDSCTKIIDESLTGKPDTMPSGYNTDIDRQTVTIEVQKMIIDELSTEIRTMKVDYELKIKSKDLELASLREKCEQFQLWVERLDDNTPRDDQIDYSHYQNIFDKLIEENKSLKKKNIEMFNKINDFVSEFYREFRHCPNLTSINRENECSNTTNKINDFAKCENKVASSKVNDFCVVDSTANNEEPATTAVVDSIVQKAAETNKVQQAQPINKSTETSGNNIDSITVMKSNPIVLEVESTSFYGSNNDVACTATKESYQQVITERIGQSGLNAVNMQDRIETIKTTVNDKKKQHTENKLEAEVKVNPIGALQELCASRQWAMPKYKFFEADKSGTSILAECTVLGCTIKAEALDIKAAKRQVATLMYHTVKRVTRSNASENNSEKNVLENERKCNGLFENACEVTSASLENKPVTVDKVDQRTATTNKVQHTHSNNELSKNVKGIFSCVSDAKPEQNGCKVTTELIGNNELRNVHEQGPIKMIETTVNNKKKHRTENEMDIYLKLDPICALQNLCMSRNWILPKYEFFKEGDSKIFTYTVVCTFETFTVEVNGMMKKEAKRKAATLMYHKLKNYTKISLEKNDLKNKFTENEIFSGLDEKPAVFTAIDAAVLTLDNDKGATKINEVSTLNTSNDSSIQSLDCRYSDRNTIHEPPVNESVIVNEEKKSLSFIENVDLAHQLRLSNNSGVRRLKEIKDIRSMITTPSCIRLLDQIVEEEELTMKYAICETCSLTSRKDFLAVQITICPYAFTVVGFGETIFEAQGNATHECLTRFKAMINE